MNPQAMSFAGLYGLPKRMAAAVYAALDKGGERDRELKVLEKTLQEKTQKIPLDAGEGAIFATADKAAAECYRIISRKLPQENQHSIRLQIDAVCKRLGVFYPLGETDADAWARACDRQWWIRALRKEFARRFENTAIQLGQVGKGIDPYISRESAVRQAERNEVNAKRLAESEIICQDGPNAGQVITLKQAADAGMANKANRRNELMTRITGFDAIAQALKHRALFITLTAPSKYHAVGGRNDKYQGFTPREAQAYLCKVWSRIRTALQRAGIEVYGFRVAEPHEDACPHWHLLLFTGRANLPELKRIIKSYALQEDGNEAGAKKQRVKIVTMESGKGTAAGYIAKYISKNIDGLTADGSSMGEHEAFAENEDGGLNLRKRQKVIAAKYAGRVLTPAERVTYWSQVHGIRQFQQIGGAPVGVWRELRRVEERELEAAPLVIRDAWQAVQKVDTGEKDEAGKPIYRQADWAAYVRLQGGPGCGRDAAIQLWKKLVQVQGRYGIVKTEKPCGIYAVSADDLFRVPSVRYEWKPVHAAAAPVFPWTCVNNCTRDADQNPLFAVEFPDFDEKNFLNLAHWAGREMKKHDPEVNWAGIVAAAEEKEAASKALQGGGMGWNAPGAAYWNREYLGPPTVADLYGREVVIKPVEIAIGWKRDDKRAKDYRKEYLHFREYREKQAATEAGAHLRALKKREH